MSKSIGTFLQNLEFAMVFQIKENETKKQEICMLTEYSKNRTWKFLDAHSGTDNVTMESNYDFLTWLKRSNPNPLSNYRLKNPVRYFFSYTPLS